MKRFLPLFALPLLLWSCGGEEPTLQADQLPAKKVTAQTAQLSEVPKQYRFPASLTAKDRAQLSTRLMGTIIELNVDEGDRVRKGQVLARIRSADIEAQRAQAQAQLAEAEAGLANLKTDYERLKTLQAKGSATQKELDDATAGYRMAQARVEAAKKGIAQADAQLAYATVKAPFDGVVVQKMTEEGAISSPGMPLLAIEADGGYEARAQVPESEIALFKEGDRVKIRIDALGASVPATVDRINPAAQYGAQYQITLKMQPKADLRARLKSGMYADAVVEKGAEKRLMVDEKTLVKRGQLEGLFLVSQENEALLRWVRTGKRIDGKVEILSGVAEGEKIVLSYEGTLKDGQKVQL